MFFFNKVVTMTLMLFNRENIYILLWWRYCYIEISPLKEKNNLPIIDF
jgi:hypothetical protein